LVAGCQPKTTANSPGAKPAKPSTSAAQVPEPEGSFEQDALEAMVGLAGRWTMLGISKDAQEPPSAWYRHAASDTCMPKGSKSWQVTDQRTYGRDDESVSLWNESVRTQVTLYTYPAQQPLEKEFEGVMSDMSRTCTEGPLMTTKLGETHVGGCVRRLDEGLLLEQAVLMRRGTWLHKARITFAAAGTSAAYTPAMSLVSQAFAACRKGAG
jgi:hypothetical protein